jgi:hypothetical protein
MSENARSQGPTTPHGSMAEEAAKLVDVAHLWLVAQSAAAPGGDDVWAQATPEDHIPAECRGCPYCRVRRTLADVSPEAYAHLADAVASIGAAIRALDAGRRRDGGS